MDMDERKEGTDWETRQILEVLASGDDPTPVQEDASATDRVKKWLNENSAALKLGLTFAAVTLLSVICIIAVVTGKKKNAPVTKETYVSSPRHEDVAEAAETVHAAETLELKEAVEAAESAAAAAIEAAHEETAQAEKLYQDLHRTLFGEEDTSRFLGCVTSVSGFTDREKREIGFMEADFLKDAGAFLAKMQIATKRIIVEDRIGCSSNAGIAFQGRLEGQDDYILDMVFYPDLPGEYVFLLRSLKGNEQATEAQTAESGRQDAGNSQSGNAGNQDRTQNQNQAPVQVQIQLQQTAGSSQVSDAQPENRAAAENTSTAPQETGDYDATSLSVKRIPETLLNYLDNRYEFQYGLYEYLYHHGKKDIKSASVTDYGIDGDTRTAVISLQLSDGSGMTAVYDKTANTYSFSR